MAHITPYIHGWWSGQTPNLAIGCQRQMGYSGYALHLAIPYHHQYGHTLADYQSHFISDQRSVDSDEEIVDFR